MRARRAVRVVGRRRGVRRGLSRALLAAEDREKVGWGGTLWGRVDGLSWWLHGLLKVEDFAVGCSSGPSGTMWALAGQDI